MKMIGIRQWVGIPTIQRRPYEKSEIEEKNHPDHTETSKTIHLQFLSLHGFVSFLHHFFLSNYLIIDTSSRLKVKIIIGMFGFHLLIW